MGKIDKEKLLEEFRGIGSMYLSDVRRVIKNFPEEPEIDFDAHYEEWSATPCKLCNCLSQLCKKQLCFKEFLKSKNITVPKPVEIPVKKTWTLKKEYEKYSRIIGHTPTTLIVDPTVAPDPEFYDYKEDPDYSKIPKGSIVEIECLGDKFYRTFVKFEHENIFTKDGEGIEQWSPTVIIRIVELAKEKV